MPPIKNKSKKSRDGVVSQKRADLDKRYSRAMENAHFRVRRAHLEVLDYNLPPLVRYFADKGVTMQVPRSKMDIVLDSALYIDSLRHLAACDVVACDRCNSLQSVRNFVHSKPPHVASSSRAFVDFAVGVMAHRPLGLGYNWTKEEGLAHVTYRSKQVEEKAKEVVPPGCSKTFTGIRENYNVDWRSRITNGVNLIGAPCPELSEYNTDRRNSILQYLSSVNSTTQSFQQLSTACPSSQNTLQNESSNYVGEYDLYSTVGDSLLLLCRGYHGEEM